jgi:hypothetical protein
VSVALAEYLLEARKRSRGIMKFVVDPKIRDAQFMIKTR